MITRRTFLTRNTLLAASAAAGLSLAQAPTTAADAAPGELQVWSFNLRYASDKAPNDWPTRRPVMSELIQRDSPDVIGTQEGLYSQLKDLGQDLTAYDWIGTGRDGGSRGEFMAVFYKKQRLEPLAFDHFWLSDTPNVIASTTWGNSNRRMVTWVEFRDRQTQKRFQFWNTHFDHINQNARERSAQLVLQRIRQTPEAMPVVLAGDFNAPATRNRVYDLLVTEGGLADSWFLASERRNETVNTFNDFQPAVNKGERIDWILLRGKYPVRATEILTHNRGGQNPSDHFPLATWLTLP